MASEVKVKLVEGTTGIAIADGNAIVVDRSSKLGGTELLHFCDPGATGVSAGSTTQCVRTWPPGPI